MNITDPIADLLTRIRNASQAKHATVDIPASNMKKAIAQILVDEGYVKSETKRMIEDALSINEDILGIENFECSFKNDKLTATFKLNTKYGGGEVSV